MTKNEFRRLFERAIESAASNAERQLGHPVPRAFQILLHGAGHHGDLMDIEMAVDKLYLGEDTFYRIIDVAVVEISQRFTKVFVRASGHRPGTFEQTWNKPPGSGPFKQLFPVKIETSEDFYS